MYVYNMYVYMYIYIHSDVMKTIQCTYLPHHRNGFVATCRLWTASGGVHALLVLEPTECSTSTRPGAYKTEIGSQHTDCSTNTKQRTYIVRS